MSHLKLDSADSLKLMEDPDTGLQIVPFWIDGAPVSSSTEITFPVHSAKQEKSVFLAYSADTEIATRAADVAWHAFGSWRETSANSRRNIILKAAELFEARRAEIIAFQVEETSCEASWADFNLNYGLNVMREIAGTITSIFGEMPRVDSEANLALVFKEAVGPCLLISPLVVIFILSLPFQLMDPILAGMLPLFSLFGESVQC